MGKEHDENAIVFKAVMHADAGEFEHFLKELSISVAAYRHIFCFWDIPKVMESLKSFALPDIKEFAKFSVLDVIKIWWIGDNEVSFFS